MKDRRELLRGIDKGCNITIIFKMYFYKTNVNLEIIALQMREIWILALTLCSHYNLKLSFITLAL